MSKENDDNVGNRDDGHQKVGERNDETSAGEEDEETKRRRKRRLSSTPPPTLMASEMREDRQPSMPLQTGRGAHDEAEGGVRESTVGFGKAARTRNIHST